MAAPGLINEDAPEFVGHRDIDNQDGFSVREFGFDYDIAIVGLGYVGLPTSLAFHAAGSRVLGVDVSERRLSVITDQRADLLETDRERLTLALADPSSFQMTNEVSRLSTAAAVIICVPTPVDEYLVPDLRILASACATVV